MEYQVSELFQSLQGEGMWTGCPMYFIRLFGCNKECEFCDTNRTEYRTLTEEDILKDVEEQGFRHVLLTGGEPTLQNLRPLIKGLHSLGSYIHLETNGSVQNNIWTLIDWITLSPKDLQLQDECLVFCNEVKIPWNSGSEYGEELVHKILELHPWNSKQKFYLQPINDEMEINQKNVQSAIQFCKDNPDLDLSLSMQMHKIWRIR